mgnify:CR=1 FL=1
MVLLSINMVKPRINVALSIMVFATWEICSSPVWAAGRVQTAKSQEETSKSTFISSHFQRYPDTNLTDRKSRYAKGASPFHSRAMYVWEFVSSLVNNRNDRESFFDFCKARSIKTVFVSAHELIEGVEQYDKYRDFIAVAHSSYYNMEVHALFANMSGSWTRKHSELKDRVAVILDYNSAYPSHKFDGIHLDIEFNSATYSPWDIDHPDDSDDYVGLLTDLKDYSPNGESMRSQGMALSVATEHWWSNDYGPQVEALIEVNDLDYFNILAYRDHVGGEDGIRSISEHQVRHANSIGKSVAIALETQEMRDSKDTPQEEDKEKAKETFFEEGKAAFEKAIKELYSTEELAGLVVHYYGSYVLWYMIDQMSIGFSNSAYEPAEVVTAIVNIRKADNLASRVVKVGLSVRDPQGRVFPDESDSGEDTLEEVVFITADREKTVSLSWTILPDATLGRYDATIVVWDIDYNYAGMSNEKKCDRERWVELDRWGWQSDVFKVRKDIVVYPNPCYPDRGQVVTIANLSFDSEVRIRIYDLAGDLVRALGKAETTIQGGSRTAIWNCRNDDGKLVSRGIYVYFILDGTEKRIGKIAIIK